MKLIHLFFLLSISWLLLKFYAEPRLRKSIKAHPRNSPITKYGALALLSFANTCLPILMFSSAITWILLLRLGNANGGSVQEVERALDAVTAWRSRIEAISGFWSVTTIVALTIGMGAYVWYCGRRRMKESLAQKQKKELERIIEEIKSNKLEELPSTQEMQILEAHALALRNERDALGRMESPDAVQRARLREINGTLAALREGWEMLDLQRRMKVEADVNEIKPPPPRNKLEKVATFFFSEGLLTSLGRGATMLFTCMMLLMVPSMLGIYSAEMVAQAGDRIDYLEELRFKYTAENVQRNWTNRVSSFTDNEQPLSAQEEEAIQDLASIYEHSLATNNVFAKLRMTEPVARAVRSAAVREQILNAAQAARPAQVGKVEVQSVTTAEPKTGVAKAIRSAERVAQEKGPQTWAGKSFADEMTQTARKAPSFKQTLLNVASSFQRPATGEAIATSLGKELLAEIDPLGATGEMVWDQDVQRSIRTAVRSHQMELLTRMTASDLRPEHVEALLRAGPLEELPSKLRRRLENTVEHHGNGLQFDRTAELLKSRPPSVEALPESAMKHADLKAQIDATAKTGRIDPALRGTQATASYSDYFPAHVDSAEKTAQGRLISDIISTGIDQNLIPADTKASVSKLASTRFSNSRNFTRLRGFSRVGGVLIGKEFTGEGSLDFTNFTWQVEGDAVRMVVYQRDGVRHTSRPLNPTLVHMALAYASDGRPTAVTMVKSGLPGFKILTHPTLLDTALGWRIIELDRFVDKYSDGGDLGILRSNEVAKVYAQHALYKYGWAVLVAKVGSQLTGQAISANLEQAARELVEDNASQRAGEEGLRWAAQLTDTNLSPMLACSEYSEEMVRLIVKAAAKSSDISQFRKEIEHNALLLTSVTQDRISRMTPPLLEHWSGVREKDFLLRVEDVFPGDTVAVVPMFDFMLQVAFPGGSILQQENLTGDPWEFPSIKKRLHEGVLEQVMKDPTDREILRDAEDFTRLQRFFRVALAGQLGDDFPLEKMVQLATEMRSRSPANFLRTPRWNAAPGAIEADLYDQLTAQLFFISKVRKTKLVAELKIILLKITQALEPVFDTHEKLRVGKALPRDQVKELYTSFQSARHTAFLVATEAYPKMNESLRLFRKDLRTQENPDIALQLLASSLSSSLEDIERLRIRIHAGMQEDDEQKFLGDRWNDGPPPLSAAK